MFLPKLLPQSNDQRREALYRKTMRENAVMGGKLFGPIPKGHRREFFCLDRSSWVWHEEWLDSAGKNHVVTTRYDVRPQGILKSQGKHSYQLVQGDELRNFYQAVTMYCDKLRAELAASHA
ncbi:MAG TPA: hypothetical protein PK865_00680 [Candidatus Saccharibacteria bacterium]|nr:hypothetical protein [Candidatus Saccharibacteria bacterium]